METYERSAALPHPAERVFAWQGMVDESSPAGDGFLAEVTAAWEQAAEPARAAGVRVAHTRLGPVLSPTAGMLKRLLPVFRAGAGGVVGSGRQPMSWIGLDDARWASSSFSRGRQWSRRA